MCCDIRNCIARRGRLGWKLYCNTANCIVTLGVQWFGFVLQHRGKLYCRTTSVLQQAVGLECIAIQ